MITASVQSIASPAGAFLSGFLMDRWGRRSTLILCTVPFTVSWLILAFATKHVYILAARAMAGFASGLTIGPTQVQIKYSLIPYYKRHSECINCFLSPSLVYLNFFLQLCPIVSIIIFCCITLTSCSHFYSFSCSFSYFHTTIFLRVL